MKLARKAQEADEEKRMPSIAPRVEKEADSAEQKRLSDETAGFTSFIFPNSPKLSMAVLGGLVLCSSLVGLWAMGMFAHPSVAVPQPVPKSAPSLRTTGKKNGGDNTPDNTGESGENSEDIATEKKPTEASEETPTAALPAVADDSLDSRYKRTYPDKKNGDEKTPDNTGESDKNSEGSVSEKGNSGEPEIKPTTETKSEVESEGSVADKGNSRESDATPTTETKSEVELEGGISDKEKPATTVKYEGNAPTATPVAAPATPDDESKAGSDGKDSQGAGEDATGASKDMGKPGSEAPSGTDTPREAADGDVAARVEGKAEAAAGTDEKAQDSVGAEGHAAPVATNAKAETTASSGEGDGTAANTDGSSVDAKADSSSDAQA